MRACCAAAAATWIALAAGPWAPARGAGRGAPARPVRLDPRDPEPLVTQDYLDVAVALRRGALQVLRVTKGSFAHSQAILRFRGRYEIRLYAAGRLLDIVRFAFPLTGAAGERTVPNIELDRALARGVNADTSVRVPFSPLVTRAVVLDTRTGRQAHVDLKPWVAPPLYLPADGPQRTSVFPKR